MSNLSIRTADVKEAPGIVRPLNDVLALIDQRLQTLELLGRTFLIPNVNLLTGASVAVGTRPFPLRLGLPQGITVQGLVVLKAEDLTSPGGVSTTAHVVNAWHQEGGVLLVDFITGLAVSTSYRFTLGGFRAL